MRLLTGILYLFLFHTWCFGQVRLVIETIPENTDPNDTLFLASSLNKWSPHDKEFIFTKDDSGKLAITFSPATPQFEFKITRGGWEKVEVNQNGTHIKNRTLISNQDTIIHIKVAGWLDAFPKKQRASTASKNVVFTPTNIEIPQLNRRRTVRIYFPPNYSSGRRFPVIYMHDGQNLFDDATSFSGEWGIDETLDSLYSFRGFSCIVVGIYNDDKYRMNEYSPWKNDSLGMGGEGDEYARFIVKTLKPFIDSHYRTLPDRDNTVIMGSSMGGLISLYIALEYPDIFGKAGIFSPSFWFSQKSFDQIDKYKLKKDQKIFLVAGSLEGGNTVDNVKKAEEKLRVAGFDDQLLQVKISSGGYHNEGFWGSEFGDAIKFLFK